MISRSRLRQLERGLWGIAVACTVMTGTAIVHARPVTSQRMTPAPIVADDVSMYDRDILAHAAESAIANDVFRTERRPSRVAFGTGPIAGVPVSSPARPHLTVSGIAGGPPWRAVLNGVPNTDGGRVVAAGDTLSGLRVRSIRRDTVIVQGQDTIWTLTVEH
jgi:hypothetical protein